MNKTLSLMCAVALALCAPALGCSGGQSADNAQLRPTPKPEPPAPVPAPIPQPRPGPTDTGDPPPNAPPAAR